MLTTVDVDVVYKHSGFTGTLVIIRQAQNNTELCKDRGSV